MRFGAVVLAVLLLAGCDLRDVFLSAEARINKALQPEGTEEARVRLQSLLAEFEEPDETLMARWENQLRARALQCAGGYKPPLFASDDEIRGALTDKACFEAADRQLLAWLHWRTAGLLLAAAPLRPLPQELPAVVGIKDHILNARFAAAAGVVAMNTSEQFVIVDLTNGETLAAYPSNGLSRIGELSPNGRLLVIGTHNSTRFLDTLSGAVLLNLETSEANRLQWLDDKTAITSAPRGDTSVLLDFSAGRLVSIDWMYRGVTRAMAVSGQKDVFTLAYSGGFSRMKLERAGDDVRAVPLGEITIEGGSNTYDGSFTPDGSYFISTMPDIYELDVGKLELTKRSLYPLKPGLIETPGPGMNEMLIGQTTPDGRTIDMIYRPEDQTVRLVKGIKTQRGNLVYVRSMNTLMKTEGNRLIRIDGLEADEPVSLFEMSAAVLEGRLGAPVPVDNGFPRQYGSAYPVAPGSPVVRASASSVWVEAIGVYEGSSNHSVAADVLVDVRSSGKNERVLLLSSYEAVRWRLSGAGVQSLKAIYISSYKPSTVLGAPASIPIKVLGSGHAYQRNDASYKVLDAALVAELGKGIDSFQGTYRGSSFSVGP